MRAGKAAMEYPQLERRDKLTPDEFFRDYVGKKPVIFTDVKGEWGPVSRWTPDYFRKIGGELKVKVRPGYKLGPKTTEFITLNHYFDLIEAYQKDRDAGMLDPTRFPPYLHDTPMLEMLPVLGEDLKKFPAHYLPRWYRHEWERFLLFFIGPSDTFTPLHFDTCETNNLFFQVRGRKRFVIIRPENRTCCYPYEWRWSPLNTEKPDLEKYPLFREASPVQTDIGPGDILYIPPGSFHEVRALEPSISFNLDWHTRRTAIRGTLAAFRGMPLQYVFYNVVHAVGMCAFIPCSWVYPLLRLHLSIVD
jgi:hypothetical protein